jgi:hypothetical protein
LAWFGFWILYNGIRFADRIFSKTAGLDASGNIVLPKPDRADIQGVFAVALGGVEIGRFRHLLVCQIFVGIFARRSHRGGRFPSMPRQKRFLFRFQSDILFEFSD